LALEDTLAWKAPAEYWVLLARQETLATLDKQAGQAAWVILVLPASPDSLVTPDLPDPRDQLVPVVRLESKVLLDRLV